MVFLHYLWILLWLEHLSSEKIEKGLTRKRSELGTTSEEYKKLEKRVGWFYLIGNISISLSITFFILLVIATRDIHAFGWGSIILYLSGGFFEFFFFKWCTAQIILLLKIRT